MRREIVGLATTLLVSGGLGLAGFGLAAGTAQAWSGDNGGPYQWCPGQTMNLPTGPGPTWVWDMHVCHTWYRVGYALGNVPSNYGAPSYIWDGDNPPPPPPPQCGPPTLIPCSLFP